MRELRFDTDTSVHGWTSIDDRVMGGLSVSSLRFEAEGFAVFEGRVSAENGGGFASVRHPRLPLGGSAIGSYRLVVRTDGKRYKLNLRIDQAIDAAQYQVDFQVRSGLWSEVELPVSAFQPRLRGRVLLGLPPLDPVKTCQVGLMIGDRQTGDFRLEIRSITCY